MSEQYKTVIDTSSFRQSGLVDVDGKIWTVVLPSAKAELQISRSQRRQKLLDRKIEDGTATEADFNEYDNLEEFGYTTLKNVFRDSTPDNAEVENWFGTNSLSVIIAAIESIKDQVRDN